MARVVSRKAARLLLLVAGVFGLYLCYSYVQELLFRQGFKPYGFYITLIQFVYYVPLAGLDLKIRQIKLSRTSMATYAGLAFLTVTTMACSNASLSYVSLPVQIIFKSCKLIPVMIGGILIQRKKYGVLDYLASLALCCGLVIFATADMSAHVSYSFQGIILLCMALCADAVIGNVQEKVMKQNGITPTEMVFFSYSIGTVYLLLLTASTGELAAGFAAFQEAPLHMSYGLVLVFAITGYLGVGFVLRLVSEFDALTAVTVTNLRKAFSMILSFIAFPKPYTTSHILGGVVVAVGVALQVYSKKQKRERQSHVLPKYGEPQMMKRQYI